MSIFGDILNKNQSEDAGPAPKSSGSGNLSPYLNFDPHYIPRMQPEFLYPDDSHMATTSRRTNVALPQIGVCCMSGAALGGVAGLYNGLRATTLAGQMGKVRRTQVLNYVMKQGSATGCTLGIVASFYACIGVALTYFRDKEDKYNTFIAAGTTGMIYKSTAGFRAMGVAAAVGVGLAGLYTLATDDDKIWGKVKYDRSY